MKKASAEASSTRRTGLSNPAMIATDATVVLTTGLGPYTDCRQTMDFSPLEPGNAEYKFYAENIGVVLEVDLESGELLELVEIIEPRD